jgi:hypothetical protein
MVEYFNRLSLGWEAYCTGDSEKLIVSDRRAECRYFRAIEYSTIGLPGAGAGDPGYSVEDVFKEYGQQGGQRGFFFRNRKNGESEGPPYFYYGAPDEQGYIRKNGDQGWVRTKDFIFFNSLWKIMKEKYLFNKKYSSRSTEREGEFSFQRLTILNFEVKKIASGSTYSDNIWVALSEADELAELLKPDVSVIHDFRRWNPSSFYNYSSDECD